MNKKFWYYLHENGELVYKRFEYDPSGRDFVQSPFCRKHWLLTDNKDTLNKFLEEASALGASKSSQQAVVDRFNLDA